MEATNSRKLVIMAHEIQVSCMYDHIELISILDPKPR